MKIELLREIIKKDTSKDQFAVLTNITNGSSEIFELGKPLSKEFETHKEQINNYFKLLRILLAYNRKFS